MENSDDILGNLTKFDRFIGYFSPQSLLKRAYARQAASLISGSSRGYDGAGRGRRFDGWRAGALSANGEIIRDLSTLRNRHRDLVRNNVYAGNAVSKIASYTVGTGIVPYIKPRAGVSSKRETEMNNIWEDWAGTTAADVDGLLNFFGQQAMVMRTTPEAGEIILRRIWRRKSASYPLPFQIQLLEPDFLDTSKDGVLTGGGFILQGIEFNSEGRRVAYHLYREHPGEFSYKGLRKLESVRVPAEDIIHHFKVLRAGQVRGVPWGASCFLKLRDFDDYQDATLLRQKLAACYTAFITNVQSGNPNLLTGSKHQNPLPDKLEAGLFEELGPGQDIRYGNPPEAAGVVDFSRVTLQGVSVGYEVPYELLSNDLSGVTFLSGRIGFLSFYQAIDSNRWLMMEPLLLQRVWKWVQEGATLAGVRNPGDFKSEWTPPARQVISPTEEVAANIKEIRAGLKSLPEALRERGMHPKKVMDEYKEFNKYLDEQGLLFDTDPRKMTATGIAQGAKAQPGGEESQETDPEKSNDAKGDAKNA